MILIWEKMYLYNRIEDPVSFPTSLSGNDPVGSALGLIPGLILRLITDRGGYRILERRGSR